MVMGRALRVVSRILGRGRGGDDGAGVNNLGADLASEAPRPRNRQPTCPVDTTRALYRAAGAVRAGDFVSVDAFVQGVVKDAGRIATIGVGGGKVRNVLANGVFVLSDTPEDPEPLLQGLAGLVKDRVTQWRRESRPATRSPAGAGGETQTPTVDDGLGDEVEVPSAVNDLLVAVAEAHANRSTYAEVPKACMEFEWLLQLIVDWNACDASTDEMIRETVSRVNSEGGAILSVPAKLRTGAALAT